MAFSPQALLLSQALIRFYLSLWREQSLSFLSLFPKNMTSIQSLFPSLPSTIRTYFPFNMTSKQFLPIPSLTLIIQVSPRPPLRNAINSQINHWLQRNPLEEKCHFYPCAHYGSVMTEATCPHVLLLPQVPTPSLGLTLCLRLSPLYQLLPFQPQRFSMSSVFYLDLVNVLSLTFLYFLTPFSIFPPNHLFMHAAPESRLLKLLLFQSQFLISVFPMATFRSLIFQTSMQHCLCMDSPLSFPFQAINLFCLIIFLPF